MSRISPDRFTDDEFATELVSPPLKNESFNKMDFKIHDLNYFNLHKIPWGRKPMSLLVHLSQVVGLSNLVFFPHLCGKHGGAAFLVPYLVSYVFVGIPLLYAEMIMGQFSSLSHIEIFRRMSPALAGVAVAMFATTVYRSIYFSAIITQILYSGAITLIGFFQDDIPGDGCMSSYNSILCFDPMSTPQCTEHVKLQTPLCGKFRSGLRYLKANPDAAWLPPHTDYLLGRVFKPEYLTSSVEKPAFALLVILFAVWILAGYLSFRGIRRISCVFVVLKGLTILVVIAQMILSLFYATPDNGGLRYFLAPDFANLLDMEAWTDAVSLVLFSLTLGDGTVHKIASYNEFTENFLYNAILVSVADILVSVLAGITFFSSIGSVSKGLYGITGFPTTIRIHNTLKNGFPLAFTAFPEHMMLQLSADSWQTVVVASSHYFHLAKAGFSNLVMYINLSVSALLDIYSEWRIIQRPMVTRFVCTLLFVLFGFFSSIFYVAPAGIYLTVLLDEYTGVALLFICLAEIIIIIYGYGFKKFLSNIETMLVNDLSELRMSIAALGIWYYLLTPAFLVIAICLKIFFNSFAVVDGYRFPLYFEFYGVSIGLSCAIMIPLTMFYHFYKLKVHSWSRIGAQFEPTNLWYPIHEEDRRRNIKNERANSVYTITF